MAISTVGAVGSNSYLEGVDYLSGLDSNSTSKLTGDKEGSGVDFGSIFQSAVNMISDTNDLTNAAQEEEIKYSMGEDNTLDLLVAQNKANLSLSYTVAVRDKVLDAYKEIMNMQF